MVEAEPNRARTLHLGADGTGVPVRKSETEGRKGKQPDGSARTREAKLAVVWSAERLGPAGAPTRDPDSATHNAAIETAKAIHGPGSDLAQACGRQRRRELDEGRIDDLLAALAAHADTCEAARRDLGCFARNRHRMRYPAFRAMGLCIGSGVVEGACKNVVGTRLKRGGMHWSVDGANAILALRCAVLSNRFDDFWERRAGMQ